MSDWQLTELFVNGRTVYLDLTHHTCVEEIGSYYYLYSLVVRCQESEIAGIRLAYGESVQVLICHWHIKRAWRKNIAKKVCVRPGLSTSALHVKIIRDDALNRLNGMLRAGTEEDFELAYDELQIFCIEHEGEWDMSALQYQGHMNTNNHVEAWHRTLKEAYLGKLKR
ncbi:hypothetical protein BDC45DRAFT_572934 [Circinella umbellata]|nr:hypothetical protein BDC45DRAFT_573009 [Circinella umbellata]KAI7850441.1 hypothetical protein BDC45DRAFT_572934 [Circinella umbellata]